MAISVHSPYVFNPDLVTFKEAAALFEPCGGHYAVKPDTLKRWAFKHKLTVEKAGKTYLVSWTALLEVHREETDRREASGR